MKRLFLNTNIIDGSGNPAFRGSVLVEEEKITQVFTDDTVEVTGDVEIIDIEGRTIAPGFIDGHSHNDWYFLRPQNRELFFDPLIAQGITSVISGNCGFSASCFAPETENLQDIGGQLFSLSEGETYYPKLEDWFAAVDGNSPVNVAHLVGHGSVRTSVAGMNTMDIDEAQEQQMLQIIDEGLAAGACGVSLGLMYQPGIFAPIEELEKVAGLCAKHDKMLTVHPRSESALSLSYSPIGRSHLLRAVDELDELTRATGCRMQHSHLIFVGRKSWDDVDEALEILEKLDADGYSVGFDMYPVDFGASVITVILPDWYQALSEEKRNSKWVKFKLKNMIAATTKLLGFGFEDIRLAYAGEKNPQYNGRYISEIAETEGRKQFDVYLQVCEDSNFTARVLMGSYQNEEIVDRLMRHPLSNYMTDAWYEEKGMQNASLYSAFPMFLRLAREGDFPLEQAVHKMTGKTAERFQLPNRGFIREGYFADLVIFDETTIAEGSGDEPAPIGIEQVYISGTKAFDINQGGMQEGRHKAGRAIRV